MSDNHNSEHKNIFEDEIKISDYLAIIYRFKYLVFAIFIVVAIGAYYYTSKQPLIYASSGKILLESQSKSSDLLFMGGMGNDKTDLNNNIQIMQSSAIMLETAKKLVQSENFTSFSLPETNLAKSNPNFQRYVKSISGQIRGKYKIESIRDTDVLTIGYESESPNECSEAINALQLAFQEETTRYARLEYTQIREFLEDRVKETQTYLDDAEQQLRDFKKENQISELSPVSEKLVDQASTFEADLHTAMTDSLLKYTEINIIKKKITNQNIILNDLYIKDRDLTKRLEDKAKDKQKLSDDELAIVDTLESDILADQIDEDYFLSQEEEKEEDVEAIASIDNILNNGLIQQLMAEIVEKERFIIKLTSKSNYNSEHPELTKQNEELSNLKRELKDKISETVQVNTLQDPFSYRSKLIEKLANVESEYEIVSSRLIGLRETVEYYSGEISQLPDQELELSKLTRDKMFNEKIHTLITERYEDAKIAEISQLGNVRILEAAGIPRIPIKPKKMMNYLIGVILGLGIGIGAAFLAHSMDTKLRTVDDIENFVKSPIVGTIPFIELPVSELDELSKMIQEASPERKKKLQRSFSHINGQLISHYSPKSPVAEAYRSLRTNIIANKDAGPISFLITSSSPKEGKSTTVSNTAITLAQMNSRVVVVDIDMRRPTVHTKFGIDKENGASDYLIDDTLILKDVIKPSGIPNLDVITSGFIPPNPSELLASQRMDEFLAKLKENYDYVIFDTPPIIAVTDAIIMAKKVDKVFVVMRVSHTEKAILNRAKEILDNVDKQIDGFVVNGIKVQKYYSRHKYYYYYYYYYYGEENKNKKRRNRFSFLRKN